MSRLARDGPGSRQPGRSGLSAEKNAPNAPETETGHVLRSAPEVLAEDEHANSEEPYPRGRWKAWSTVIGAFLIQLYVVGILTGFGVFQEYYTTEWLPSYSASDVFLAQGVGMGIGLMFVFGTSMTMVSQHFRSRRALAMGIVAASSPLGSIMYTIALNHLFHGPVGFAWGMRYVAFATLGCFIVGNLLLHSPVQNMQEKARQDRALKSIARRKADSDTHTSATAVGEAPLLDAPFVLTMISALLWSLGATPPNFYMQLYAELHGVDQQLCFYSFAILSFASIFGRIVPGWMADRWGTANVFIPSLFMVAAISFGMFGCGHPAGLIVFALIFGYFFGTVIAMYMPMVASMTPPGTSIGRRLGVSLTPVGVGSFFGPPISGAILGPNYDWWKTIVFSGVSAILG
ncbi:major facilitator superfamily domain-containing protein [Schizophyllum fasciatum]